MGLIQAFDFNFYLQFPEVSTYGASGITLPTGKAVTDPLIYLASSKVRGVHSVAYNDFELWYFTGDDTINAVGGYKIIARTTNKAMYLEGLLHASAYIDISYSVIDGGLQQKIKPIAGEVTAFNRIEPDQVDPDYHWYEITLQPRLSRMQRSRDSRIYVNRSLSDIVTERMSDYALVESAASDTTTADLALTDFFYFSRVPQQTEYKYPFLIQYEENDLNFLQRVLAREGYYFYSDSGSISTDCYLIDANGIPSVSQYYYDTLVITNLNGEILDLGANTITDNLLEHPPVSSSSSTFSQESDAGNVLLNRQSSIAAIKLMRPRQTQGSYLGDTYIQQDLIDNTNPSTSLFYQRDVGEHILRHESFYVDLSKVVDQNRDAYQLRDECVSSTIQAYDSAAAPVISFSSI